MIKIKENIEIDYKNLFIEIIFILVISVLFYKTDFIYYNSIKTKFITIIVISILLMNIYTIAFNSKYKCNILRIKDNSKSFWMVVYYTAFSLIGNSIFSSNSNLWIAWIFNIIMLFIVLKLCKTKLRDFNYKTNVFWIIAMIIIAFFLVSVLKTKSNYHNIINFLVLLIMNFISNYGLEEFIYRGCTFSGLRKIKLSYTEINIIQSIIFAVSHWGGFGRTIDSLPYYILFGYLLGKVYITSNSLTPGILLHGIFNTY